MILSNNNGTFTPTAGGTGTFIGTAAAFNAVKAILPVNTVAYIPDDGNGDLQPVDAITNGDMHPVTSNAVYDALSDGTKELLVSSIKTTGQYQGSGSGLFLGKQDSNLEGGQATLERPTSSNFGGGINLDVYGNRVRFFADYNGSVRTFYIDFENKTYGFE